MGVNAMRNIRRKNEQVFLAPVRRGYDLNRVSVAGKLQGLSLPARRDLKLLPYVSAAVTDDVTRVDTVRRTGDVGLDVKWGVRADLTLDLTVNTDFAQVEADEQQVNLTRFRCSFPKSVRSSSKMRSCSSWASRRPSICFSRVGSVCRLRASQSTLSPADG